MMLRVRDIPFIPVLLAQAVYVRRTALRLPEADGDRQGRAGAGPNLRVLVVGDSAAAGVGVRHQSEALSGRLVNALSREFHVHWQLHAQSGRRISGVIQSLDDLSDESFDVAVVSIGVNDVTGGTRIAKWHTGLKTLHRQLRESLNCRQVIFTRIPPMEAFPALPQPLRSVLGRRASCLNQVMIETCTDLKNAVVCAPDFPLEPAFIANDGFHPSGQAYSRWAEHLAKTIVEHNRSIPATA